MKSTWKTDPLFGVGFTMVFDDLARGLGSFDYAAFVGLVYRWHDRHRAEWVFITLDEVQDLFGWSYDKQARTVKKLVALGLLRCERRGMPARRYFQVDVDACKAACVGRSTTSQIPQNAESGFRKMRSQDSAKNGMRRDEGEKRREKRRETLSPVGKQQDDGAKTSNKGDANMFFEEHAAIVKHQPHHKEYATKLRDAVRLRHPGTAKAPKLNDWADTLAKLERQQVEPPWAVLDWYCDNIGSQYVPVAMSAKAFHAKYDAIVAARQRACPETVPVTARGRAVVAKLNNGGTVWPKGANDRLGAAVDVWLAWADELIVGLYELKSLLPIWWNDFAGIDIGKACARHGIPLEAGCTEHFPAWRDGYSHIRHVQRATDELLDTLADPDKWVLHWYRTYHAQVVDWPEWSGTFPTPGLNAFDRLQNNETKKARFLLLTQELAGESTLPTPPTDAEISQWCATKREY